MEKVITVKAFDVYDEAIGHTIIENLKTFEEAEAFIIAHDKKTQTDWLLSSFQYLKNDKHIEEFKHHRYIIYHAEGKVAVDDVLTNMPFDKLCDEAFGWRAISVVAFKF